MGAVAVLYRDDSIDTERAVDFANRLESVRHRGLRQAFQALNPGLLVCHPDTFQIRYANAAACQILGIEHAHFPRRLPDALTMTRQEEFCEAEGRKVACYVTKIDNDTHDVRAFPVYNSAAEVDSVLVVIRNYGDVSWSLFEMLDRLPIAVAALAPEGDNLRYINRMALREIYGERVQSRVKRAAPTQADDQILASLQGFLSQAPASGEGQVEAVVGRSKVTMTFARLSDGTRLVYWDPRGPFPTRH